MRAMLLRRFAPVDENPLELTDVPEPVPAADEILIGIEVCGVCHTDLHTVEGDLPAAKLPLIPGHQVVGRVQRTGNSSSRFKEGDRVGAAWLYSSDGTCRYCRKNRENLCVQARFTGFSVNGGYAEFMVIPQDFAYGIPETFSSEEASPLLCAGIIGYRALRQSGIQPGGRLGLIGFGASAHIAIQVALSWGCAVYVFTRSEEHRLLARKLGALWSGSLKDTPPVKLDAIVNFTPAGSTVPDGMRLLDKGGRQALAGITMTPVPEMEYTEFLYHEKSLCSVANATRRDGEELLRIASEIPIRPVTVSYDLEEANTALLHLKNSSIDGAAVLKIR